MSSIALIGPDGAGKSTISRMLQEASGIPIKRLYMGVSVQSTNVMLPTSRLGERLKQWKARRVQKLARKVGDNTRPQAPKRSLGASLWSAARLGNRIAEEIYRQILSWAFQAQGYLVLYDRHFVYDFSSSVAPPGPELLSRRLHRWWLERLYPRPDLVIFLDAPGSALYSRKKELTPSELERRRQAFLRVGKQLPNFVLVDATQPLTVVFAEVSRHVTQLWEGRTDPSSPRRGTEV
jgi:thymidylate kinase